MALNKNNQDFEQPYYFEEHKMNINGGTYTVLYYSFKCMGTNDMYMLYLDHLIKV